MPIRSTVFCLVLAAGLAACAKKSDVAATDSTASDSAFVDASATTAAQSQLTSATSGGEAAAPLTADDVDRWAKGMAAEREAVLDAGRKLKEAKTGTDTLNAMGAALESSTRDVAANAAGVSADRWNTISSTFATAATVYAPLSASMDTTKMSPEMIRMFTDNAAAERTHVAQNLPKEVVDALAPRAGELRKQSLALTALRVKAAGG